METQLDSESSNLFNRKFWKSLLTSGLLVFLYGVIIATTTNILIAGISGLLAIIVTGVMAVSFFALATHSSQLSKWIAVAGTVVLMILVLAFGADSGRSMHGLAGVWFWILTTLTVLGTFFYGWQIFLILISKQH
jgi:VIT1/CCC1 family predicted Fe2+/Mn2+ transporter